MQQLRLPWLYPKTALCQRVLGATEYNQTKAMHRPLTFTRSQPQEMRVH